LRSAHSRYGRDLESMQKVNKSYLQEKIELADNHASLEGVKRGATMSCDVYC